MSINEMDEFIEIYYSSPFSIQIRTNSYVKRYLD